MFLTEDEVLMG